MCEFLFFHLQKQKGPPGSLGPSGDDGPIVSRQELYGFPESFGSCLGLSFIVP